MNSMGMSTEMPPRYLTVNPAGQVTYILDTSTINLAQVQLAVPASEVLLIQEEGKSVSLPNSPILVADVAAENLGLIGNNVIVLVSQAQELMIVNSDITVESNGTQQWEDDDTATVYPGTVTPYLNNMVTESTDEEWSSSAIRDPSPNTTLDEARSWFRDSLITTAALSSLSTFIQSRGVTKDC